MPTIDANTDLGATFEMWSAPDCGWCDMLEQYLTIHKLPVFRVTEPDPAKRQALYDQWGLVGGDERGMPQLCLHGKRVGTWYEVLRTGRHYLALMLEGKIPVPDKPIDWNEIIAASDLRRIGAPS